jgi:ABC-type phosphate transport system substrate-binding protein
MKKLLIIPLAFALAFQAAFAAEVVLIANTDHASTTIPRKLVTDFYVGKSTKWPDGNKVEPIIYRSGAVHGDFLSEFVGKNDSQFTATWKKLVFTGKASMPDNVDSDAKMVAKVRSTPGAIGYVAAGTPLDGVAVLKLE